jgi:hypothetical protein
MGENLNNLDGILKDTYPKDKTTEQTGFKKLLKKKKGKKK